MYTRLPYCYCVATVVRAAIPPPRILHNFYFRCMPHNNCKSANLFSMSLRRVCMWSVHTTSVSSEKEAVSGSSFRKRHVFTATMQDCDNISMNYVTTLRLELNELTVLPLQLAIDTVQLLGNICQINTVLFRRRDITPTVKRPEAKKQECCRKLGRPQLRWGVLCEERFIKGQLKVEKNFNSREQLTKKVTYSGVTTDQSHP